MKFIHLSDLHIGKRVNEFSMVEDQKYILDQILDIVAKENPEGILIAGDIYDKQVPSAEAVQVFDSFLTALAGKKIPVFAVSGNHDSPERIAFGAQIMSGSGICFSPVYSSSSCSINAFSAYVYCCNPTPLNQNTPSINPNTIPFFIFAFLSFLLITM